MRIQDVVCRTLIEDFKKTSFTDTPKCLEAKLLIATHKYFLQYLNTGTDEDLSQQEIFCWLEFDTISAEDLS